MKAAYWFLQGTTQSIPAFSDVVMHVRMFTLNYILTMSLMELFDLNDGDRFHTDS